MKKYHSSVSRRDFMKLLGLGGIGLGAAAVSVPVFHDLDELIGSPEAELKHSWYVKEVEKPTTEIDWKMIQRFDYREVMWADGLKKALGQEEWEWVFKLAQANRIKGIKENIPGYTLRDQALHGGRVWAPVSFLGPRTTQTPEELGVPRWEGTPEENARMIRAFLRVHGAAQVGFVYLETDTTEKLIYAIDSAPGFPRLDILDVDEPEDNTEKGYLVIPKKACWVIVYTIRMSDVVMRSTPTHIGLVPTKIAYDLKTLIQGQLQNFLRALGYMCLGEAAIYNSLGMHVGFGVLAGLGEQSRVMHLLTPEYGLHQRVFMAITDLPLAPSKPIDFGAMQFCRACKKCADFCPVQAIPHDTEPSWETWGKPYRSPGVRIWRRDEPRCNTYMLSAGGVEHCSLCLGVCPLSKGSRQAFYHDIMTATVGTTSVFNRFFRKMDDMLGYGMKDNPERFWELDLPPFGWD
ncbi:reductive dehalogenase [Chloroflexota bacterium]